MAAKHPEPPGNSLTNNCNNNNNSSPLPKAIEGNNNKVCSLTNQNVHNKIDNNSNNDSYDGHGLSKSGATPPKPSCNCSNISIMHLFHEMKQEFPTLPDQIVAQCVSENCHDRENCILKLHQELTLNPIPVQAYPAKVLQRQQQQQKRQLQHLRQQELHTGHLKSIHVAPSASDAAAEIVAQPHADKQANRIEQKDGETEQLPNEGPATIAGSSKAVRGESECKSRQAAVVSPRARPTTLNLNPTHQEQQKLQQHLRQQLNVQLQQHLQQRQAPKPERKAPLPPLPPKPAQLISVPNLTPATTVAEAATTSAIPTPTHHSSNTSLSSPVSSGESEVSVNVGTLSSPSSTGGAGVKHRLKSPLRHCSVINVQPEPPYSRDFLTSPSSSSGGSSSQKSFTSVNLTLRQPNATAQQSKIDISAGPASSGAGGMGLTYSSTSYDARRGCQKNFHITVSDEGGVFSASRIRPRGVGSRGVGVANVTLLRSPIFEKNMQQSMTSNDVSDDTFLDNGQDESREVLQRQTRRREKLLSALRDNKKKLSQVEQEINVLTEPVRPGESERLDNEIEKLRSDCELMLNEIENSKRCPSIETSQVVDTSNRQQLVQPLPWQRTQPTVLTGTARQAMDFVQHHTASSTPSSVMSSPNQQHLPTLPLTYQQLQQQRQRPPLRKRQHLLQHQQQLLHPSTDEEDFSDTNADVGGGEDDNTDLEMWACSMCTFRNHPQLNTCECCENVRILPGTIRIVPSVAAGAAATAATPASFLLPELSASSAEHVSTSSILTRAAATVSSNKSC